MASWRCETLSNWIVTSKSQKWGGMALSLQRYTVSDGSGRLGHILKERIEKERKSLMEISTTIAYVLPENVMLEILSWLPVKDILQFKSVCKSWYSIISSTLFLDKHMNNYYKNSEGICGIAQYQIDFDEVRLFELLVDETPRNLAHKELGSVPICESCIYDPCDGIYYLHNDEDRALWNPTTSEVKVLPNIITKPDLPSNLFYAEGEDCGFGFDLATEDYKIVAIKGFWDEAGDHLWPSPLSVLIYSLRSNSWRYWGDLPEGYHLRENKRYIFVEGCCYWLWYEYDYSSELILSFDMATETFKELDVPDYDERASKELGLYHGSIALLIIGEKEKCFDIWTLNANEGQWSKKFTMGLLLEIRRPVCHWKKNKFVLECKDGRLVLCNTDTQEIMDLEFQSEHFCHRVFVYKESLISIKDIGAK